MAWEAEQSSYSLYPFSQLTWQQGCCGDLISDPPLWSQLSWGVSFPSQPEMGWDPEETIKFCSV